MIIWKGLGFLVAVITFLCLLLTEWSVERAFSDDNYYQAHGWPKLVGMLVAALLVWMMAKYFDSRQTETRIDAETGEKITVLADHNHTLFFIPIRFWPPILIVLGIILCIVPE